MLDPGTVGLATAVFVASSVECVEAFTIVLAVGMTRSWKSTIVGSILALLALSMMVAVAGVGLRNAISQSLLQLIIGALLLVFGLQWLRKAILRESGLKAKHDEEDTYRRGQEEARQASQLMRGGLDWFAFVVSFKGVFLEGLEVVFIVITFGLSAGLRNPHSMFIASMAALAAFVLVLIAGVIVHKPLSSVPENLLKFAVGVLLCSFGTFWSSEGLGYFSADGGSLEWPGGDWTLLGVLLGWVIVSMLCVGALRRLYPAGAAVPAATGSAK
jgi:uncharacterized membrane protein